jgi:hypothetical protein
MKTIIHTLKTIIFMPMMAVYIPIFWKKEGKVEGETYFGILRETLVDIWNDEL